LLTRPEDLLKRRQRRRQKQRYFETLPFLHETVEKVSSYRFFQFCHFLERSAFDFNRDAAPILFGDHVNVNGTPVEAKRWLVAHDPLTVLQKSVHNRVVQFVFSWHPYNSARRVCHCVFFSKASATLSSVVSSSKRPMSCKPIGNPF